MPNKSRAEHYEAAEKLLEEAESSHEPDTRAKWCLELARMHLNMSESQVSRAATASARDDSVVPGGKAARSRAVPK